MGENEVEEVEEKIIEVRLGQYKIEDSPNILFTKFAPYGVMAIYRKGRWGALANLTPVQIKDPFNFSFINILHDLYFSGKLDESDYVFSELGESEIENLNKEILSSGELDDKGKIWYPLKALEKYPLLTLNLDAKLSRTLCFDKEREHSRKACGVHNSLFRFFKPENMRIEHDDLKYVSFSVKEGKFYIGGWQL